MVKGKTQKAVESVFQMLVDRGLRDQIIAVACDMNAAYPTVIKKFLPKAEIVFDQFHDIQHLSAEDSANGSLGSGDAGTFAHAGFPRAP